MESGFNYAEKTVELNKQKLNSCEIKINCVNKIYKINSFNILLFYFICVFNILYILGYHRAYFYNLNCDLDDDTNTHHLT